MKIYPIPKSPTLELPSCASTSSKDTDADFCEASTSEEPHFPNQQEIDDLIRDMGLTEENAQLLTSRLRVEFARSYLQGIEV